MTTTPHSDLATSTTFNFSSGLVDADTTPDGAGRAWASQTIGADTLTLTADAGVVSVVDEDTMTAAPDPVLDGKVFTIDLNGEAAPNKIRLSLDSGKTFDLTMLSMLDISAGLTVAIETLVITTNLGPVEITLRGSMTGQVLTMPDNPFLKGVSWVDFSDKSGNPLLVEFDNIVLTNITAPPPPSTAPSFVPGGASQGASQNGTPIDITGLLHVSDPDAGETLTWSLSGTARGNVHFSNPSTGAGGTDIAPGTVTYTPAAGFAGRDTFTIQVSDGTNSSTKTITVDVAPSRPGALDLDAGSDTGLANDDNATAADSLRFSGSGAEGDSSSTVRVFIDENGNGVYDAGESSQTATLDNGAWTVEGISTKNQHGVNLNGSYNVYAVTTSADGRLTSTPSTALALMIDHAGPTILFANIGLSQDTGTDAGDLRTHIAQQTITATLSQALAAGDTVMGSLDNGSTWTDITAMVSGTALTWTGATLVADGGIRLRVLDEHGNIGSTTPKPYVLDQAAPTTTVASALFSSDDGNDFIVNAASQTLSGTLSAKLADGEIVEVSLNNGASWTTAVAGVGSQTWSLAGIVLSGSGTLRVRVTDDAGNHGNAFTRAYALDQAAPTAVVTSKQLPAPSGTQFTVTVTYADSGAGIDTATFGSANINVTGPDEARLAVLGFAASGNVVTYTVAAPGGSWDPLDAGRYTVAIEAGSVRDVAGNGVAANAAAGTVDVVYSTAPAVGGLWLETDNGPSASDFVTNVAAQTIHATLARPLAEGEIVQGSLDNGNSWTVITGKASGTALAWDGVTLSGTDTIVIKVTDGNGLDGAAASRGYRVDTAVPVQTVLSAALQDDSGASAADFVTAVALQDLEGTLDAPLAADEFVEVSLDNGANWTVASASGTGWSLDGLTLSGSGTLQVRVSDQAGNHGTPWSHAYLLDTTAPTAAVASGQLPAPAGAHFTVTVTYADSGAGVDTATFGTGNIRVTGPDDASLAVTGISASGNVVTYTVAAPGGSWDPLDAGRYTVSILAGSVRDLAGNAVAAQADAGAIDVVYSTAPAVSGLRLETDNGPSAGDFITNVAQQTVHATLSRALAAGETVYGSVDNGDNWVDITAGADGTALAWDVTLPASGTLVIRVEDGNGLGGVPASHGYTIDTGAPLQTVASASLLADSAAVGDFVTNVAWQSLTGTLDAPLGADEFVEVSFNGGADWTTASATGLAWALHDIALPSGGTLQVRVSDLAGNHGTPWSQAYLLDTAAPTAGTPVRANLVDPNGKAFTFTVTYADGGAGIDPSTIGIGNVNVTGPAGVLDVTDAVASGNTVTYTVEAPGGAWDPLDAGSYTIGINAGVMDLAGNTVAANAAAHTFTVGVNSAPVLGGVFATPAIDDDGTAAPFAGVTVSDLDGDAITLTIAYAAANGTLAGEGLAGSAGNYTLSGSAAAVQAALRALTFTPTANQSGGAPVATTFTLAASDGRAEASNSATVVSTSPVAPTATIALSDTDLRAGESATLIVTFSEAVTGFSAADLRIANVTLGALATLDGGRTWTATVTPAAGVALGAHQVQLDLAGVLDAGGLAGNGVMAGPDYTVATVRPSASLSVLDTTLTAGETTVLTVTFSEAVSGFTVADLTVAGGALSNLATGDGGVTWTATLTPAAGLWTGANTVSLDLAGVRNAAGNAGSGSVASNPYAVQTGTPPAPEPSGTLVDGVLVTVERRVDAATGLVNDTISVPIVGATRQDDPDSPNAPLADIPLTATGPGGGSILTVSLPVGAGLQASAPTVLLTPAQAQLDLIRRIEQKTADGSGARQEMSGEGLSFLQALTGNTLLQTATVTPLTGSGDSSRTIVVSGAGSGNGAAIGLVIDATGLARGSILQLDHVDFAAVVGAATLRGGAGDNIVVGDGASQSIFLGEGDDQLYGGGGEDIIGSAGGDDLLDGGSGNDQLAGGIGNDRLAGGSGDDVLQGGRSARGAWQFTLAKDGTLTAGHETAMFAPGAVETLALAELDRGDAGLAFLSASRATLTEMALLYQAAFDRAPDLGGLNFYLEHGIDAAALARAIVTSDEWKGDGMHTVSDAVFVERLYQQALDRTGDVTGLAFWTAQLAAGTQTRADVLLAFALSPEHRARHADGIVVAETTVARENGWILGSGDDRLEGGAGSDLLVGGDGIDTVVYGGKLLDYRFVLDAGGNVKVADKANADVDTLLGIERGAFSDGTVDLAFTQADTATLATVGLLYQAVLDRAGDHGGLAWWAGIGLDAAALANAFAASNEFAGRYGAMSDTAFVAALYANTGLDAGALGGSGSWVAMLHDHSRAELVGAWIAQDAVREAHFGGAGLWLA